MVELELTEDEESVEDPTFPLIDAFAKAGDLTPITRIVERAMPRRHEISLYCTDQAVSLAAEYGHWDILQLLAIIDTRPIGVPRCVFTAAVKGGQVDIMNKIAPELAPSMAFRVACTAGQLEALQWVERKYPTISPDWTYLLCGALSANHLSVVRYIYETKPTSLVAADFDNVAEYCSLEIVQYFLNHCALEDKMTIALKGNTDNPHREVRQLCLRLTESTWMSTLSLRMLFHHQDHMVEEIEHVVALATARAARTGERFC